MYVAAANATLAPEDALANEDLIAAAAALAVQLETPLAAVAQAAALARRHGVPVFLNPFPAAALPDSLLRSATYLIPNETEAARLTGLPVVMPAQAALATPVLHERTGGAVALTLGAQGALAHDTAGAGRVPAFQVQVIDSMTAGDGFLGAFVVAITEGQPLTEALRWGCAAGALACTVLGAQPSLPTRPVVMRLLADTRAGNKL